MYTDKYDNSYNTYHNRKNAEPILLVKYLIENDLIDTVDLGRPVLADPEFAKKAIENQGSEIKKCLNCKACQYGPFTNHKCPYGNI